MRTVATTPYRDSATGEDTDLELRIGASSRHPDSQSVKFTWWDKRGHAARGGEVSIEALPQMLEFAIESGGLKLAGIV